MSERIPLRTKLITAVVLLVIAALAAISVTSVLLTRSILTTQPDDSLRTILGIYEQDPRPLLTNPPGFAYPLRAAGYYAGIQLPGAQLAPAPQNGSESIGSGPQGPSLPDVPESQAWVSANSGQLLTLPAQSGPDSWRVTVAPLTVNGQTATIVVGYDLGNVNGVIRRLIVLELLGGGAIIIVLAIVAVAAVRANLRPLDDIELTAGQIAAGHLDHRIPERDPRTEIGRLGRSLNSMLSQIEAHVHAREESEEAARHSEERMRRFIADASHELRTPLTTIRGFAEYYRQRGGVLPDDGPALAGSGMTRQELDRIMRRLESEANRMGMLVEDLLQLARLDQQRPLDTQLVDLLTLAADAVQDARVVAPQRPVDLTVAPGAAFLVNGDEARLRQVIGNLVNNALAHTPPEASVTVALASGTLASGDPAVVLDVVDDGPGMTAEQAHRVFERFYRADAARNRASGGTGLGLAIVDGLVRAHGGSVSVQTAPGEGADFCVRLPLAADALSFDEPGEEDLDPGDIPDGSIPGPAVPADEPTRHRG